MINDLTLYVNGAPVNAADVFDDLTRAVIISLFSWLRALPDDVLPGTQKMGWWADGFPVVEGDQIGSRLWLLLRGKLVNETVSQAQEMAAAALQWLVDDGVAARVDVVAERPNLSQISLGVVVTRGDLSQLNIRFVNVWSAINAF